MFYIISFHMEINYLAILVCGVLSMVIGAIWYGPLFGKKWMEICGVNADDLNARKEMQKGAAPLYAVQLPGVMNRKESTPRRFGR